MASVIGQDTGNGYGVLGESTQDVGVQGTSDKGAGVQGKSDQGVGVQGAAYGGDGVEGRSEVGEGVHGQSNNGIGVHGQSLDDSVGVFGESERDNGVLGYATTPNKAGVFGYNDRQSGIGVVGLADMDDSEQTTGVMGGSVLGTGVIGLSKDGRGVVGHSQRAPGVFGDSEQNDGVVGIAEVPDKSGVFGYNNSEGGNGVGGGSVAGTGVFGFSSRGPGVFGDSKANTGVVGWGHTVGTSGVFGGNDYRKGGNGITGFSDLGTGVVAHSDFGLGLSARGMMKGANILGTMSGLTATCIGSTDPKNLEQGVALFGQSLGGVAVRGVTGFGLAVHGIASSLPGSYAGWFDGDVRVTGRLLKMLSLFQIDHPLDPANKYLEHAAIESPEMKNIYDGVAVLDEMGEAIIELPEWFEALNENFRYQLTAVGGPAPNLHIASEIKENHFSLAGGPAGIKVCWQVTGTRCDPWAKANPMEVEVEKPGSERGTYLYPELHGISKKKGLRWAMTGDLDKHIQKVTTHVQGLVNNLEKQAKGARIKGQPVALRRAKAHPSRPQKLAPPEMPKMVIPTTAKSRKQKKTARKK